MAKNEEVAFEGQDHVTGSECATTTAIATVAVKEEVTVTVNFQVNRMRK